MSEDKYPHKKKHFIKIHEEGIVGAKEIANQKILRFWRIAKADLTAVTIGGAALTAIVALIARADFGVDPFSIIKAGTSITSAFFGTFFATAAASHFSTKRWAKEKCSINESHIEIANWIDRLQEKGAIAYVEGKNGDAWLPLSPFGYPSDVPNSKKMSLFVPRATTSDEAFTLLNGNCEKENNSSRAYSLLSQIEKEVEKRKIKEGEKPFYFLDKLIEEGIVVPSPDLAKTSLRRIQARKKGQAANIRLAA